MNILTRNKSILDGWRGAGDVTLARGEGTRWRNGSHTTALATPGAWERAEAARKNAEALAEARLAILTARKNAAEKEEEEAKASYAAGVDWWARSRYSEEKAGFDDYATRTGVSLLPTKPFTTAR
jgi:hypothetical protein